ncbi:MAG: LysR family transcriptional regulator [Proteobacteria bacterium]|nr:LysR family transcriptional regulator [Pseudomonadota bacterium]
MAASDRLSRVPPLQWVRAFEAAARHESFITAAKELSLSAGAVSRSVKQLEAFLGTGLFVRGVSSVKLTDGARAYAHALAPALRQISVASLEVRTESRHQLLRVSALPALAQCWLVPRLNEFNQLYPDITVRIAAESVLLDPTRDELDVALRCDDAPSHVNPSADCTRVDLFAEDLFPVLSPELAQRVRKPEDLFELTALHDTCWETDWATWLTATGAPLPKRWRGLHFTLYAMALDAAIRGQGVLIGHSALIQDELQSGKLIAPFSTRLASKRRYYALTRSARALTSTAVQAFLGWLTAYVESAAFVLPSAKTSNSHATESCHR